MTRLQEFWTMQELARARELVEVVGLPTGSAAKLLSYEFGTHRTADKVRAALHKYFDWHGATRGSQTRLHRGNPSANVIQSP